MVLELGGMDYLYRMSKPSHPHYPGRTWPQNRSREPGACGCGVDLPLAATILYGGLATAALDRGSPNFTGTDGARKFGVC